MKMVKEWNYKDLMEYANLRACDGNWSMEMAMTCISFISEMNKKIRKEKYWQENKHLVFNIETFPNLAFDIETGEYDIGEVLENE